MRKTLLVMAAAVVIAPAATAQLFPDSLWTGNDTTGQPNLNIDKTGATLRVGPGGTAVGFGVDVAGNMLYVNDTFSTFSTYNLTTLAPIASGTPLGGGVFEDLTFNGTDIVGADFFSCDVIAINPVTGAGAVLFNASPGPGVNCFGIAYDGSGYWISDFFAGTIHHWTSAGVNDANFTPGGNTGGLAYDTSDGTLWVGDAGAVRHFTTGGAALGTIFNGNTAFVDGLEYQGGAVPEPGTLASLAGMLVAGGLAIRRRRCA